MSGPSRATAQPYDLISDPGEMPMQQGRLNYTGRDCRDRGQQNPGRPDA